MTETGGVKMKKIQSFTTLIQPLGRFHTMHLYYSTLLSPTLIDYFKLSAKWSELITAYAVISWRWFTAHYAPFVAPLTHLSVPVLSHLFLSTPLIFSSLFLSSSHLMSSLPLISSSHLLSIFSSLFCLGLPYDADRRGTPHHPEGRSAL